MFTGPLYDVGYYRILVVLGSALMVFSVMMLSLATKYYQVFLAQGVGLGLGSGMLFIPTLALVGASFSTYRALAMGVVTSGIAVGKFQRIIHSASTSTWHVDSHTAVRAS